MHDAHRALSHRRVPESGEIVLPDEMSRGAMHSLEIQFAPGMMGEAIQ